MELLERVRAGWAALAPARFGAGGFGAEGSARVFVAPDSSLAPAGWVGIVTLAGATSCSVPDLELAPLLETVLNATTPRDHTDPSLMARLLPVEGTLGPATLAYHADDGPPAQDDDVLRVQPGDPLVRELLQSCSDEDAAESALADVTSQITLVVQDGIAVTAAGSVNWPNGFAHLSVLTRPGFRGQGLAVRVAAAATADALSGGRICQWRARPAASQRVAEKLGYQVLGSQLSLLVPTIGR